MWVCITQSSHVHNYVINPDIKSVLQNFLFHPFSHKTETIFAPGCKHVYFCCKVKHVMGTWITMEHTAHGLHLLLDIKCNSNANSHVFITWHQCWFCYPAFPKWPRADTHLLCVIHLSHSSLFFLLAVFAHQKPHCLLRTVSSTTNEKAAFLLGFLLWLPPLEVIVFAVWAST